MEPASISSAQLEQRVLAGEDLRALFHAQWCGFCAAVLRKLRHRDCQLVLVDISRSSDPAWDRYRIGVVPTAIHFTGGKVVERLDGVPGLGLTTRAVERFAQCAAEPAERPEGGGSSLWNKALRGLGWHS